MSTAAPSSQFAQRARGASAGLSARGGQSVFASSAPRRGKAGPRAAAPSARSATAELRNGFSSGARSSLFAAEASSAGQAQNGIGAPLAAGLGVLGLGLAGILGASLVLGLRRRRAQAGAGATGSDSTER